MSLISTQPLPVKQVIYTAGNGGKLTFILSTPYVAPLFLATMVITRSTNGHISSSITPGTDGTHGGKLLLYVDTTTFGDLRAQAVIPFNVVLSFDDVTLDIVAIEIVRNVAALSQDLAEALVAALQQSVPNSQVQAAE